jgi:hypothetical protein
MQLQLVVVTASSQKRLTIPLCLAMPPMSGWTKVGAKPNQQEKKGYQQEGKKQEKTLSEQEVFELLCTFKVRPCNDPSHHDYRCCIGYHSQNDQRRESRHAVEKMYHPLMFRTYACGANGPNQ